MVRGVMPWSKLPGKQAQSSAEWAHWQLRREPHFKSLIEQDHALVATLRSRKGGSIRSVLL
jgi:hypothetical protein